jgi:hypothetical protein
MSNSFSLKTKFLLVIMALSITACGVTPKPSDTLGTKDTTAAVDNSPQPTESGCPQEGHIKSPSSYNAATVTFDNQTAADLKVYWLDFNGARKFYSNLKAHSKYDQATWVGHVWVVADGSDQCLKLESANAVEQTLIIN